jgi:hypothetical protein
MTVDEKPALFGYGRAGYVLSPPPDGEWLRREEVKIAESWKKDVTLVVPEIGNKAMYPLIFLESRTSGATCEIRINGVQYAKETAPHYMGAHCRVFLPTEDFHTKG